MPARFQYMNYDRAHDTAVIIYNMLMLRIRIELRKPPYVPRT